MNFRLPQENLDRPGWELRCAVRAISPASSFSLPTTLNITVPRCWIGADARCTVRLAHPDVLPVECLVLLSPRGLFAWNISGRVRRNDEPFTRAPIAEGDRLTIGPLELTVTAVRFLPEESMPPTPCGEDASSEVPPPPAGNQPESSGGPTQPELPLAPSENQTTATFPAFPNQPLHPDGTPGSEQAPSELPQLADISTQSAEWAITTACSVGICCQPFSEASAGDRRAFQPVEAIAAPTGIVVTAGPLAVGAAGISCLAKRGAFAPEIDSPRTWPSLASEPFFELSSGWAVDGEPTSSREPSPGRSRENSEDWQRLLAELSAVKESLARLEKGRSGKDLRSRRRRRGRRAGLATAAQTDESRPPSVVQTSRQSHAQWSEVEPSPVASPLEPGVPAETTPSVEDAAPPVESTSEACEASEPAPLDPAVGESFPADSRLLPIPQAGECDSDVPRGVSTPDSSDEGHGQSEIERYLARLLERLREEGRASRPPERTQEQPAASQPTGSDPATSKSLRPRFGFRMRSRDGNESAGPSAPAPRQVTEEEVDSFRQLASQSARSALLEYRCRRLKRNAAGKLGMGIFAGLMGLLLFLVAGAAPSPAPAILGASIALGVAGIMLAVYLAMMVQVTILRINLRRLARTYQPLPAKESP